jgi:4-amino-4-deoxy-L-arabinose transferase-like glycosyltransferase
MKSKFAAALTSIWLIFFLAVGVRLAYAWEQQRKIPGEVLLLRFHQETGNIAYSLAMGKGFSSPFGRDTGPTAWVAPVYPLLIAGIFRVFGVETIGSFFAATSMNILFSAATCLPIFYAGKRIAGQDTASAAAWFWAFLPNAVIFPFEWIWDTSLTALLAATLLWATLELAESPRLRNWCAYGLLWGFALLTNPSLGSVLPFLLGWAAYRAAKRGAGLRAPALAAACVVLCCAPWTIRNYRAFHRFVPLRSNLGVELYTGNNENYGPHPPVWPFNITREREIFRFYRVGESAFMQEEMRKALHFVAANPGIELRLTWDRVVAFWLGTPAPFSDFLSADSLLLRAVFVCGFLLLLGTVAGLTLLFLTASQFIFPLASFVLFFPLIYYLAHASLRFRHPLDPILVLLSAIPFTAILRFFDGVAFARRFRRRDPARPT